MAKTTHLAKSVEHYLKVLDNLKAEADRQAAELAKQAAMAPPAVPEPPKSTGG